MIRDLLRKSIKETDLMNHNRPKSEDSLTFQYNTYGSFDIAQGSINMETMFVQMLDYVSNPSIMMKNSKILEILIR